MSLNFITKLLVLLLLPLLFTAVSCNKPTEPPPPENYALEIIAVDASCTEVWLEVKSPKIELPQSFTLTENGEEKGSVTINKADTTLLIENLLPKKSYKYQLKNTEHKSNQTEITTLDTTSHNFTWQTFEFGQHSSSVLYDVAIIDENNIWAVGEIYMNDSNGNPDPKAYNAVHWNGTKWELKRIPFAGCGAVLYPPIYGLYAFNENDIWFTRGGTVLHYYDNTYKNYCEINPLLTGSLNKLWGSSSNDLYAVGNNGNIVHWNGSSWKKIASGTTLPIMDVYGARDPNTGMYEVLCVSADQALPGHSQILKIENSTVREVATHPEWEPWCIWFVPGRRYIHAGDGLWESRSLSGTWNRNSNLPSLFKTSIDGQAHNDIIVSGAFWLLSHWNGVSWHTYFPRIQGGSFGTVAIKGNLIIVVGFMDRMAVALVGRR